MNDTIAQFNTLLEKYKLVEPISPEQQEYIIKQRKSDLKKLLKKTGQYGIIIWLSILIFERLRDFGITLTLVQSKIILGLTAAAIASGSATGVYTGTKYIIKAIKKPEMKIEEKTQQQDDEYIHLDENASRQSKPSETTKIEKKAQIKKIETEAHLKKDNEKQGDQGEKKKQKKDFETEPVSDVPTL